MCESMQVVIRGWVLYIKGVCGMMGCMNWGWNV